jgi:hypothetical protein
MPDKKLCFVAGPIGAAGSPDRRHADWLLKGIIEPVFSIDFVDFKVERADNIATPGMIDSQVINRLLDAELVIADMTLLNANAFYEMGIRHMKRKPIIHMFQEGQEIPFDVKPHRAIPFDYDIPQQLTEAQNNLRAAVKEVLADEFVVENPVTRARGQEKIDEHAMPELMVLSTKISAIDDGLKELQAVVGAMRREARLLTTPRPPEYVEFTKLADLGKSISTVQETLARAAEPARVALRNLEKHANSIQALKTLPTVENFSVPPKGKPEGSSA